MVKVSVIMPVYNAEQYLEEAINGILNQTLDDLELICVDDGSEDNSLAMLNEFAQKDKRIKVYHQENQGGGAARNVAMRHATGEYLYCMDADDMIERTALKECYDIATEKQVEFIIFQSINYEVDTKQYKKLKIFSMDKIADKVGESIFSYRDLGDMIFDTSSTPWCKFYNMEFVKRTGAQFAEGLIFHDNIFWWDILLNGEKIYFYRKCLYTRRNHSKSSTGAGDRRYIDSIEISELIWQIFIKHNQFDNYKKGLGFRKFDKVYHWYKDIDEAYKEEFFQAMKKDYKRIADDRQFYDYFTPDISKKSKLILDSVVKSDNSQEFDERMENFNLKDEIKKLKRENKKLKKEIEELKTSSSWKVTSPLRSLKKSLK